MSFMGRQMSLASVELYMQTRERGRRRWMSRRERILVRRWSKRVEEGERKEKDDKDEEEEDDADEPLEGRREEEDEEEEEERGNPGEARREVASLRTGGGKEEEVA